MELFLEEHDVRRKDEVEVFPCIACEPSQQLRSLVVPAGQVRVEVWVVDEGRVVGVEEARLDIEVDALELGIADDDEPFARDAVGDKLVDDLRPGNEAAVEARVIGMVGHAAIPGAVRHLRKIGHAVFRKVLLQPQAGPLRRDDHVRARKQRNVGVQAHQATCRKHAIEDCGQGPAPAGQFQFFPADQLRRGGLDQFLQAAAYLGRRIGNHRLDIGMQSGRRGGDTGKVSNLVTCVVIEKENGPHGRRHTAGRG